VLETLHVSSITQMRKPTGVRLPKMLLEKLRPAPSRSASLASERR
jgi:hypothetical protein